MAIKPRIKLKANKRATLSAAMRFAFEVGEDRLGVLGNVELRDAWKTWRDAAMEHWFANGEPFTRPAAWWLFDSPEPRPAIVWNGGSPGGDPYAADRALRRAKEIDILVRHGLLTKEERKLLAKQPAAQLLNEQELQIDLESEK